jgi:uncharacterized protein with HEPN domain
MTRDHTLRLKDILDNITQLENSTSDCDYEEFIENADKKKAAAKCFEEIGEAVKNIPDEITSRHPSIPWNDLARMKDVLVHQYFRIDYDIIWKAIKETLPGLKPDIEKALQGVFQNVTTKREP